MLTKTREENLQEQGGATRAMTMIQALRSALDVTMGRDEKVVVFGQDVGYFGGVFRVTEGQVIALDGKVVRGTCDAQGQGGAAEASDRHHPVRHIRRLLVHDARR